MRNFYDSTREGEEAKFFTMTLNGYNYVYSNQDDVNDWLEVEKLAGNICKKGIINDNIKPKIKVIDLNVKQGKLRGTKKNYIKTNPFVK